MFEGRLDRLDTRGILAAVEACTDQQIRAENSRLELAAGFADRHPAETIPDPPADDPGGRRAPRVARESAVRLGGEGTPTVAEFCIADFAVVLRDSVYRARSMIAAALDLRHRLPNLWSRVCAGTARGWMAEKVAEMTRPLSLEAARKVDAEVADSIGSLSWWRFQKKVRAEMLKADPDLADRKWKRRADERFVRITDESPWGTRDIHARIDADTAQQMEATITDLGKSFKHHPTTDTTDTTDTTESSGGGTGCHPGIGVGQVSADQLLRARAFGTLANPLLALRRLAEQRKPALFDPPATAASTENSAPSNPGQQPETAESNEPATSAEPAKSAGAAGDAEPGESAEPGGSSGADDHDDQPDQPDRPSRPTPPDQPTRRVVEAGDLDWLTKIDLRRLLPRAVLHVHISRATLQAAADDPDANTSGITRVEEIGPLLAKHTREWLGRWDVRVQPVLDLADVQPVDAYEVPDAMRDALFLRTPVSCFPWSSNDRRSMDADHRPAYRFPNDGDPPQPGQTGLHSLGPLGRWEHRVSTHGRWSIRHPVPGTYLWRSPYGYLMVTNDTGTHYFGANDFADAIWDAANRLDQRPLDQPAA